MLGRIPVLLAASLLLGSVAAQAQLVPRAGVIDGALSRLPPLAPLTPPATPIVTLPPVQPPERPLAGVSRLIVPVLPPPLLPPPPAATPRPGVVDLTPNSLAPLVDPAVTLIRLPRPCARLTAIAGRLHCAAAEDTAEAALAE